MKLSETRLTVVGLGLMGGSIASALRGVVANLTGVDQNPQTVELATHIGFVDHATMDLASALEDCDLVLLAVPVRAGIAILHDLGKRLPSPPFVIDVSSTKLAITAAMNDLPPSTDPIGGHPLCGKESGGLGAADRFLFREQTFILAPLERTTASAKSLAVSLVEALGANPVEMDAAQHDQTIAVTSHLPHLLGITLVQVVARAARRDPEVWTMVSSGYQDTSRLAGSDPAMLTDILVTNRDPILEALDQSTGALETWRSLIAEGDPDAIRAALEPIQRTRRQHSQKGQTYGAQS